MSQKPISRKPFLDLATLHMYVYVYTICTYMYMTYGNVTITRPIGAAERLIMFLNAIFKVCKISKTKRRNTY